MHRVICLHACPPYLSIYATLSSLCGQHRRQRRQLEEFFSGVDILASTEGSASLLDSADSGFEDMFPGDDGDDDIRGGRGVDKGWMAGAGTGRGRSMGEGDAAVAVRKCIYHLRQLKQVRFCISCSSSTDCSLSGWGLSPLFRLCVPMYRGLVLIFQAHRFAYNQK